MTNGLIKKASRTGRTIKRRTITENIKGNDTSFDPVMPLIHIRVPLDLAEEAIKICYLEACGAKRIEFGREFTRIRSVFPVHMGKPVPIYVYNMSTTKVTCP
ncbi:unnamed protein product [Albugo candida]|uniref:Uncharacterized protein n=1 Tax=Albugo candida TaxID=65357 RepID=A0A024GA81_9STRA|nr:unnamed protein product [Albugo candida]|eukprot:CCI43415.1 unnamed protein product [Albugo candida]